MANSNENLNVVSRPGQVTIEDVRISAGGGSMSILGQLLSFDFFESIFSPFMIGNMVIDDGVGLIKNLPITGRELISIRYKTPLDTGDVKEVNLQIVSQINRTRTDRRNDTIQFRLLSPTGFSDLNQKLSRSYEGTNSEIVKEICKEYYGEEQYWWIIAWYNLRPLETDFKPGDVVYIPTPLEDVLSAFEII